MTPVINPWVFYLMPVCENLSCVSCIIFIIGLIGCLIFGFVYLMAFSTFDVDEEKSFKCFMKLLIITVVISGLLACVIPSEETITKMLIAQNVTVERVDVAFDTVVNVYNDIMNLFRDSGAANG